MIVNETDSSSSDGAQQSPVERSQKKKKRKKNLTANLSATRYKLVRQVVEDLNFQIIDDDSITSYIPLKIPRQAPREKSPDRSHLIWNDTYVTNERVAELECFQKINHFPGMAKITRKDYLARNFQKMQRVNNEEFDFHPLTWIIPPDFSTFSNYAKNQKRERNYFIVKPANGAQGHGIFLCKSLEKSPSWENSIVQEYIDNPLLIDGYKFDLRLYVLITSCDPLRIFVFKEGLVRLSTEQYFPPNDQNLQNLFMHLTNYSINKHNEYYEKGVTPDSGSKRSIKYLNRYLRTNDYNVSKLWQQIYDLIIKTMIIAEPHLLHNYRNSRPGSLPGSPSVCFEILGFDVIIDQNLRPWLLEVNRSPSLAFDQQIDFEVKSSLLEDALRLLHINSSDKKKNRAVQKAQSEKRLFRGIQKVDNPGTTRSDPKKNSNKRKEELLNLLDKFRRNAAQEAFENENCGQFYRIFPSDDKLRQQKYTTWMTYAFLIFQSEVKNAAPRDVDNIYNHTLQEDDILNLLAEFEDDESSDSSCKKKNPKQRFCHSYSPDIEEKKASGEELKFIFFGPKRGFSAAGATQTEMARKAMNKVVNSLLQEQPDRIATPNPIMANLQNLRLCSDPVIMILPSPIMSSYSLVEDDSTKKALQSLNEFHLRFPGKNDWEVEQLLSKNYTTIHIEDSVSADIGDLPSVLFHSQPKELSILWLRIKKVLINKIGKFDLQKSSDKENTLSQSLHQMQPKNGCNGNELKQSEIYTNWKLYKSSLASYWLIKLDSVKRRKIIEIVRSNVRILLQKIWTCHNIESTNLFHLLQKVFNRLLWSHGQGLWNCFSSPGNSWEVILSKSTEIVSETELECCRRVVKLCKDCLLIVFQFATETQYGMTNNLPIKRAQQTLRVQPCFSVQSGSKLQPNLFNSTYTHTSNSAGDLSKSGGPLRKTMTNISSPNPPRPTVSKSFINPKKVNMFSRSQSSERHRQKEK